MKDCFWSGKTSDCIFYCTFGLTQKYQKVKHGEKLRARAASLAERSRKTALFARSLPALTPRPSLFPHFSQCIFLCAIEYCISAGAREWERRSRPAEERDGGPPNSVCDLSASRRDAGGPPPPHAADCNSPDRLVHVTPPSANRK